MKARQIKATIYVRLSHDSSAEDREPSEAQHCALLGLLGGQSHRSGPGDRHATTSQVTGAQEVGEGEPLRFAFYGRSGATSISEAEATRDRQLRPARHLIEPHGGQIVIEYFDLGTSRSTPWHRRPQARALVADAHQKPGCFDAVVIGRTSHVFHGEPHVPHWLLPALLEQCGVSMWIPEIGGPADPHNEEHDLIMRIAADPFSARDGRGPLDSFGTRYNGGTR
ncbi:hypothetical protein J4573_31335 [Actinomadura barringtoniae]|uniref:Resolvase/invertase-type recombinase catalytic domain-containing protein n=1 Tax=Actinomadura barringtoniae TaxID=1427535 RepID=A0A939PFB2_9ACTN|nr:hypothetical protein [Actinomadura barringtoniae]MBO2451620.1 hypothetical protein [Actinomadura barringtoniae]